MLLQEMEPNNHSKLSLAVGTVSDLTDYTQNTIQVQESNLY